MPAKAKYFLTSTLLLFFSESKQSIFWSASFSRDFLRLLAKNFNASYLAASLITFSDSCCDRYVLAVSFFSPIVKMDPCV